MYTDGTQVWYTNFCKSETGFVCEVPAGVYVQSRCLYGWTEFQGFCYRKYNTESSETRDNTARQCEEAHGGMLATINSKDVNDFITKLPCPNINVRIGLQCPNTPKKEDTRTCVRDYGTPFSYSSFAPGQPTASTKNLCGYTVEGNWFADVKCDNPFESTACQAPLLNVS